MSVPQVSKQSRFARREFLRAAAAIASIRCGRPGAARADDALPVGVLQTVGADRATGTSQAVVVGDVPLVHTAQTFRPASVNGGPPSSRYIEEVLQNCVRDTEQALANAGSTLDDVVRWNFYVGDDDGELAVAVRLWLSQRYRASYRPSVSIVNCGTGGLGIAADCVGVSRKSVVPGTVLRLDHAAVLPPGDRLYVSGEAQPGAMPTVVGRTLESLQKTLAYCGLNWSHVVQLKTFLQPIAAARDVRREMQSFFGGRPLPVLSFVEWSSSETIPLEIELIAAVPPELGNPLAATVEYLTPPHLNASPVFSRAARVSSKQMVYVSGLFGDSDDPERQVRDVFAQLRQITEACGSDLHHLVKATYYVTDDATSKALGAIRPEFYDPARPPAASKALVVGTGKKERTLTLDMIAVPKADR